MRNLRNVPLAIIVWLYAFLPIYSQDDNFNHPEIQTLSTYQEGVSHFDSTDWASAAANFREAVKADSQMKAAWFNLAYTYFNMGDFHETERHIEKLLSIDPFYGQAHELLGMTLYHRGEYARAIKAFNYAIIAHPTKELQVARAICFIAQGNPKYSLPDLDNVLYDDPGHLRACLAKSAALIELDQHAYALRFLNRILDNDPENVAALTNRAICHYRMGNQDLSKTDFENAIFLEPTLATLLARAKCALSSGLFKTAISDVKAAMLLNPNASEIYYILGEIEIGQGKCESAVESFDIAITLDHNCLDCMLLKSEAEAHISDFGAAVKDIYSVLESEPNNEQAREMLLWVYTQMDKNRNVEK